MPIPIQLPDPSPRSRHPYDRALGVLIHAVGPMHTESVVDAVGGSSRQATLLALGNLLEDGHAEVDVRGYWRVTARLAKSLGLWWQGR